MTNSNINKSKIFMLILGLAMCLALMLGIAMASSTNIVYADGETLTPYDSIVVNGKSSESFNNGFYLDESYVKQSGNPTSDYVAKYNNGVLTLNNYNGGYVGTSATAAGYYEINLIGNNVITGSSCVLMSSSHGGRVTIKGDGTLTLNAGDCGIDAGLATTNKDNDVVIEGNAKVTINATRSEANETVCGIIARNVTIKDNASVDIIAKNTNTNTASNWVEGIFAHNSVTINTAGTINIDVSEAGGDSAYSYGIQSINTTNCTKVGNMTVKWKAHKDNSDYGSPILKGSFSDKDHAINEDKGNCYASYRYGTPRYVIAANGKLAGPGIPESLNTNEGNFLAGDKITLNAQNLQVSETNTTNIPFDKWFSFASDVTITNPTNQTGAEVPVQDKDIEVRANYKAFTVQPVFERESGTKGTVTFTLISNEFNTSFWLNIRPINDLSISKGSVVRDSGTTFKATLEDNGTVYGTPAGEYVVEVKYNNKTLYSEPFTVDYTESKATVDSVTISGEQGEAIANKDITITLTGYTFATALSGNWITNLPDGLVQSVTKVSDTEAKITVSGTPTALSDQVVAITIPKANISGLASDLTAESNSDAKFNIVAPLTKIAVPTAKTGLTYTALTQTGVEDGVGYTLTGNSGFDAKNYTAIAKLVSGYKWNDGTITDKEIPWSIGKRNPVESDFNYYNPSNLTYDGNAKTATVSLIVHYGDETGFAVTVKYKKGGVIVAEAKDAGEYEVYIDTTATANFNSATDIHDVSWKFKILKATPSRPDPSLFTVVAPTSAAAKDGKIIGVTSDMEYYDANEEKYVTCPDGEMTGLHTRQYAIRYKETDNYRASEDIIVTVPPSGVSSFSLIVINGTGKGKFAQGERRTIIANTPEVGKEFDKWVVTGITLPDEDLAKSTLTFTMPANDVTMEATYKGPTYNVSVTGGTTNKAKAKYGETVAISATIPNGKKFVEWTSESGITFADKTSVTTTFTMPAAGVTVEASFEDETYSITVTDGTATPDMAKYQAEVIVKANDPATDMYFDKWEVTGITLSDEDLAKSTLTFNMPAGNVSFKATYRNAENFVVTVTGGTGAGTYKEGDSVTVTADAPSAGKVFKGWKDGSGKIVSKNKNYTFTVEGEINLTAVYDNAATGGSGKGGTLSGGKVAGIVIGVLAAVGAATAAVVIVIKKKRK